MLQFMFGSEIIKDFRPLAMETRVGNLALSLGQSSEFQVFANLSDYKPDLSKPFPGESE